MLVLGLTVGEGTGPKTRRKSATCLPSRRQVKSSQEARFDTEDVEQGSASSRSSVTASQGSTLPLSVQLSLAVGRTTQSASEALSNRLGCSNFKRASLLASKLATHRSRCLPCERVWLLCRSDKTGKAGPRPPSWPWGRLLYSSTGSYTCRVAAVGTSAGCQVSNHTG
jgi:hypothetical protein